jgi:hypothetical protein
MQYLPVCREKTYPIVVQKISLSQNELLGCALAETHEAKSMPYQGRNQMMMIKVRGCTEGKKKPGSTVVALFSLLLRELRILMTPTMKRNKALLDNHQGKKPMQG